MRRNRGRAFSRKMRLVPIDSTKNIVQIDNTIATVTVAKITLAVGVRPQDIDYTSAAKSAYIEEGAMLRGFYLAVRLSNRDGNVPGQEKVVIVVRKNEANSLSTTPTLANMNQLSTMDWKNKIFFTSQAKPPGPNGIPMIIGPIKIPRRFHKMSYNDVWELLIANNSSGSIDVCGICLYKWYR